MKTGGISKAYLGSKYFDPSLIEPIKKKSISCINDNILDAPLNLNVTNVEDKVPYDRPSRSQPKISRNTFMNSRSEKDEFTDHFR